MTIPTAAQALWGFFRGMNMPYLIGIDGGGTKTLGVLTDLDGRVLATASTGATNPNDVTPPVSAERLTSLCETLWESAGLTRDCLSETSLFLGLSGGINHGPTMEGLLRERFPEAKALRVRSDAHILLSGEIPTGDGACIICGTGSVCFARKEDELHRIGGWGYLLDSGGSGYDIGRDALEAVLRAFDGRGVPTLLTELLTDHLGGAVNTRITEIYREGKPYIASCAPLVFEAAERGDGAAASILTRNAAKIAEYIGTARRFLFPEGSDEALPVVMGGSISPKAKGWTELVVSLTDPTIPLRLTVASMPPVFGAVVEARKQMAEGDSADTVDFHALRKGFGDTFFP